MIFSSALALDIINIDTKEITAVCAVYFAFFSFSYVPIKTSIELKLPIHIVPITSELKITKYSISQMIKTDPFLIINKANFLVLSI